ncbi:MAG TPA: hypothetical protein VGO11_24865 [Chthoniobacteraceae bacterium]|jgi:hypothetical protein|nr:hypothetical protein [Chthoniobacteraceae bacterium]
MNSTLLLLLLALAVAEPKPPMIRIEYRVLSSEIAADSFAAKPRVLYIAGTTFSRTEEQPDPALGIHGLIVCAEPDLWMINLIPRTAQHIVDPGPTFIVHNNILDRKAPKEFATFEFGKEVEFFWSHHADPLQPRSLDGQRCEVSDLTHEKYRIVLFVRPDTKKPFHLDVFQNDKALFSVRYLNYQTDLPFEPELFKPPPGLTISEPGQKKGR